MHWHFHKKCYSIVDPKTRLVVKHSEGPIFMKDVEFVVRPGGHKRVLKEKRKNVHAFIKGTRMKSSSTAVRDAVSLHYDPYISNSWHVRGDIKQKVVEAHCVKLCVDNGHAKVLAWM